MHKNTFSSRSTAHRICGVGFHGSERMSGWLSSRRSTSSEEVRGRHLIIIESFASFEDDSTIVFMSATKTKHQGCRPKLSEQRLAYEASGL